MKLNDPFGRVEQKDETAYRSLRASLQENNIDSQAKALNLLRSIRFRAISWTIAMILLLIMVAVLFDQYLVLSASMVALILLWLLITTLNGHRFIKRYMREELGSSATDSSTTPNSPDQSNSSEQ